MASRPITSWQIDRETVETMTDFLFLDSQNHCRWWLQPWNKKTFTPWKKSYNQPREHIKKQRHYFAKKGPQSQSDSFSSCHIWIWELNHKGSWAPKNWCFWTVVLEKTHEHPLDRREIRRVIPKGNQSWIFIGRNWNTFCHLMWKSDSLEKTLMLGKIEDRRRRGQQRMR